VRRPLEFLMLETRRLLTGDVTSTTLSASAASAYAGVSVTFTAQVSDVTTSSSTPTGSVSFYNGTNLLDTATLSSGTATYTTSTLPVGTYALTAVYAGVSGQYLTSTSAVPNSTDIINTIAGGGSNTGSGIAATAASLGQPTDVVVDSAGDVYIADSTAHIVQEVTPSGIISTIAGNGTSGSTGNGGQATAAELNYPDALAIDSAGDLFIADSNAYVVREITTDGVIHAFAGNGTYGDTGNGGQATAAEFGQPSGLAFDSSGDLYIADAANVVREVLTTGVVEPIAGVAGSYGFTGNGGQATAAKLNDPTALAFDTAGNLYIADQGNQEVRKVTPSGIITDFAGNGTTSGSVGGQATAAGIYGPDGLAFDSVGDLYIAAFNTSTIYEVAPNGVIQKLNGGSNGSAGDGGPFSLAHFYAAAGMAIDAAGDLFIGDEQNHRVQKVTASLPFTVNPSPYFTVTSVPTSVAKGTQQQMIVTEYNANGTINTSYSGTVHFTSSDSSATLPSNATLTNGVGIFNVTFATVGTQSVTATDTSSSNITGSETGIVVASATQTSVSASATSPVYAGISITFTATVTATSGTATGTVNFYASSAESVGAFWLGKSAKVV
jgi:sugar lactone lactonase YvrE